MPTPGFPAGTLTEEGDPAWIEELASEDPNHLLHVVRGLSPEDAVAVLGGSVLRWLPPLSLPAERLTERTPLARGLLVDPQDADGGLLVAGRHGEWTFVYDDSHAWARAADGRDATVALADEGRVAATSGYSINADTSISYAVDGEEIFSVTEPYHLEELEEEEDIPADLVPATRAAGVLHEDPELDYGVNMRVVCAVAGLTWTVQDLRSTPLLIANLRRNA